MIIGEITVFVIVCNETVPGIPGNYFWGEKS